MTPTEDIQALRDAVRNGARARDADAIWDHYCRLEAYVDQHHGADSRTVATLKNVRSGVSQFTRDVRARAAMPFRAFTSSLSSLEELLGNEGHMG